MGRYNFKLEVFKFKSFQIALVKLFLSSFCVFPFRTEGDAVGVVDDVWPWLDTVAFTLFEPKKYIAGANTNPATAIITTNVII